MTLIKICGITSVADALAAIDAGANLLGVIFAQSPRRIDPRMARDIAAETASRVLLVGVFRDAPVEQVNEIADDVPVDLVQLHGDESLEYCANVNRPVIKRFAIDDALESRLQRYRVFASLLDPGCGSGQTFDWGRARGLRGRIIIAGGLHAQNVAIPVRMLRPFAVDAAGGVESAPGRKDARKMRDFVQAVRQAEAGHDA